MNGGLGRNQFAIVVEANDRQHGVHEDPETASSGPLTRPSGVHNLHSLSAGHVLDRMRPLCRGTHHSCRPLAALAE